MQPIDQYRELMAQHEEQTRLMRQRYERGSYVRLATFIVVVASAIGAWQVHLWLGIGVLLVGIAAFSWVYRWHEGLLARKKYHETMLEINAREISALAGDHSWNATGQDFVQVDHPYQEDLDILGDGGIFQMINRAQTLGGQRTLAGWLSASQLDVIEIRQRQEAVRELMPIFGFRQSIQETTFDLLEEGSELAAVHEWLATDNAIYPNKWHRMAMMAAPFLVLPALILWSLYIGFSSAWVPLIPTGLLLLKWKKHMDEVQRLAGPAHALMQSYSRSLSVIEQQSFASPLLRAITSTLQHQRLDVSTQLRKLGYAITQLNVRDNFFALLFNLFGLWDFHWVWTLERIKGTIRPDFNSWIKTVSEIEALCSLATLAANHPDWCFAEMDENLILEGVAIGHPLIGKESRVTNALSMPLQKHIKLITGSNMAGKSTFLRCVGVNMAMAMAGGPSCATSLRFAPMQLYTSMRTRDNLQEGASTFYAELARLEIIIKATEGKMPVFFLLDEILKGTNSADRHLGSRSLILQLLENGGCGLVATHDLALTDMEKDHAGFIENWYFDVVIEDERLAFDYRMKRGICQSFNATHLMRTMGFKLIDEQD